ncbi:Serine/threonine-protein kinase-like domain protein [Beauveria brongniartii RCEF 3172]|uniref:non-specific serine/threonine protein kinase n=1 Tax=Beauveria brongniartii RCEF 3172 TaxID=1081107 RepID=A0A162K1W2_9HYPO|nr:Serine/threonine-protein kinase-like domain protein [Beauveria brongniartii RCEF 3172]
MTDAKTEAAHAGAGSSSSRPSVGPDDAQHPQSPARDAADNTGHATGASTPAVRFSSAVQEFSPVQVNSSAAEPDAPASAESQEVTPEQLRAFTKSLHGPLLQERRLNTYQFEAFSLPASRVPSREEDSPDATRIHTPNSVYQSPHGSPRISALASPPLTPSDSAGDRRARDKRPVGATGSDSHMITPLPSSSQENVNQDRGPLVHRPLSDHTTLRRSSSVEEHLGDTRSHRKGMFSVGGGSVPVSRESSPSRTSASHFYSKPATPVGDLNDPYAKNRRPPLQSHPSRASIDPRFVFSKKKKHGSPGGSRSSLAGSGAFAATKDDSSDGGSGHGHGHHVHGSMADLKRFFRKSGHHKKRESSPAAAKTKTQTPTSSSRSSQLIPFADDHGLSSKYGKLGKVLGAGAGGSVRLMRRKEDGTVFAVKEFRARHTYESEKEYAKKVTAEFCVGSTLHHGNIIETLDILQEKGRWFEVMEYGPYDLFAIVMTGRMSREEVSCCFLQILNGVTYLHSLGLAHRDLKLDNVVVSEKGIMKIIDFGSAHVFKYPFESELVLAKGIVGSDPYLAPEVYDQKDYDAAAVDIWSLAIIYCCMSLRRFPWKLPRMTDNSFKLFASEPTPGHDPRRLIVASSSANSSSVNLSALSTAEVEQRHKSHHEKKKNGTTNSSATTGDSKTVELKHEAKHEEKLENAEEKQESKHEAKTESKPPEGEKKEIIRGPWRILRLLPRYSRHVVHRMLELDPKKRAKMEEILEDPWVADTVICQQLEHGEVLAADDHTHVLEPPNNPST